MPNVFVLHYISPNMLLVPICLILASYALFSLFLFFFPNFLHKRRMYKVDLFEQALCGQRVLKIAHRGGSRQATQNTIEAFQKVKQVVDMLEMDVCETQDGVLVVHHDDDLFRTCGISKHIKDFKFQQLPPFKQSIELNFAPEGLKMQTNSQKMPTLEEVFTRFPTLPMNIELKTPTKSAIKEFMRLILQHKRRDFTFVGIRGPLQEQLREYDLNGFRFMNDTAFYQMLAFYATGLLPFLYIEEATLQIPLYTQEFYHWKIRQWGDNWKTHAYFRALKLLNVILQPLVAHLRKRGIMTYYWVCNYEQDFKRAVELGACGIMTDSPSLLHEYLEGRAAGAGQPRVLEQGGKKQ